MTTAFETLTEPDQQRLLALARRSIEHGLATGRPVEAEPERWDPRLWRPAATFVTLHRKGKLRGCIGTVKPIRPLPRDVAHNAFSAAFHDPRFVPLAPHELADLAIDISILGDPEPLTVVDEPELLRQLEPGVDGLILQAEGHQGLFLPAVWESLPRPHDFVLQLKRKAGLPAGAWSPTWRFYRFGVTSFGDSKASA